MMKVEPSIFGGCTWNEKRGLPTNLTTLRVPLEPSVNNSYNTEILELKGLTDKTVQ